MGILQMAMTLELTPVSSAEVVIAATPPVLSKAGWIESAL